MAINREDFKSITETEFAHVQKLVLDNEDVVSRALVASGELDKDSDVYVTSHSFYASYWNACVDMIDAKLERKKIWIKHLLYSFLFPNLIVVAILGAYWFLSGSDVVDKRNVLIFTGYLYCIFLVFAGSNLISEFRRYYREIPNFRVSNILHEGIEDLSKTVFAPNKNELIIARVVSGTVDFTRIPYSDIFSAAIVGNNDLTSLSMNSQGVIEAVSISEPEDGHSDYNGLRVFTKSGKTYRILEPEGRNGGTLEDLVRLICDRAAASKLSS